MRGAIIGDIVGSVYEWKNIKTKDFPLFREDCFFTDDTVCTVAVADALINGIDPATSLLTWCRRYPDAGYGGRFGRWLWSSNPKPYRSYGNGAAMRVSPCAWLAKSKAEALSMARSVTEGTHNHPEGIKGALAVTEAIWMGRQGASPQDIRLRIADTYHYDMERTVDSIRLGYSFNETCQGSVPEALICALEATSFEDALRNAVSIGGDSDTIAAIAGSVAEAMYGLQKTMWEEAQTFLLVDLIDLSVKFKDKCHIRRQSLVASKAVN